MKSVSCFRFLVSNAEKPHRYLHLNDTIMKASTSSLLIWFLLSGVLCGVFSQRDGEGAGAFADCEETLIADETIQTVVSVNYPGNYPNNLACTWTILSSIPGSEVEIEFEGQVMTEPCCDYVTIRDGGSSAAELVANFRGNHTGRSYVSTFGALYVTFVTDETITSGGFIFRYKLASFDSTNTQELLAPEEFSVLTSPRSPLNYPNNTYDVWIITAPADSQVLLRIDSFLTERRADNLLIRDGLNETSTLLADLRGMVRQQPLFVSSNRVLHLRFRSDSIVSAPGFGISYRFISNEDIKTFRGSEPVRECGGELETPDQGHSGLNSPGFPNAHAGDLMCTWIITAPVGERIRIWFNYIHTERCCDWIKVRDGTEMNSPKLGVISGYPRSFESFISSSNTMRVEFDTDSSQNARGFTAFFENYRPGADDLESRCGGDDYFADETLQYISTPNWPGTYDGNLTCIWTIQTTNLETQIRLHLLGVITEAIFDRLQVFDGISELSPHIITLSGKGYNQYIITSSGSFLTLRFLSDRSVHHGGFRASYTEFTPTPAIGTGIDKKGDGDEP